MGNIQPAPDRDKIVEILCRRIREEIVKYYDGGRTEILFNGNLPAEDILGKIKTYLNKSGYFNVSFKGFKEKIKADFLMDVDDKIFEGTFMDYLKVNKIDIKSQKYYVIIDG